MVQDGDGSNDVKFGAGEATVEFDDRMTWVNDVDPEWGIDTVESYIHDTATLADDHATAIVTREQYEVMGEIVGHPVSFQSRPLRTEAQRAIDEMVQLSGVSTGAAKILYDAGYRKG